MEAKKGTEFSLQGGDIHGKNTEIVKTKRLSQEWYGGHWEKPSIVTFTLSEKDGKTLVEHLHTDIPDNEAKDIDEGWYSYYLGPLEELLEK